MRMTKKFKMQIAAGNVNLYKWVTEMTPAEYESFSKGHKAMGSYFEDGEFYMVNVENMGNEMIVQHYQLKEHTEDHLRFYSDRTEAYICRWIPAIVGVPWEMKITPIDNHSCELSCTIGADFPSRLLAFAAWINGIGGFFMRKHLADEGEKFAKDIEKKFNNDRKPNSREVLQ